MNIILTIIMLVYGSESGAYVHHVAYASMDECNEAKVAMMDTFKGPEFDGAKFIFVCAEAHKP